MNDAIEEELWTLIDVDRMPEPDSNVALENSPESGEIDDAAIEALKESCDTDIEFETLAVVGMAGLAGIGPDVEAKELDTASAMLRSDRLLEIAV